MSKLLEVADLRIGFPGAEADAIVVDDVSFSIAEGEIVGIVGESGSGKSMTMSACLQLVPTPGKIVGGSIKLAGTELVGMPEARMRQLRGEAVSLVLQDAMTALHPALTIGRQIGNVIRDHEKLSRREIGQRAVEALEMAGIPRAAERLDSFPHQLSGGLRQRVMIAMAIVNRPRLLIADEPTTALDVTLQAQILDLFRRLNGETGLSIALVTHNFGVVAGICDRVVVMRGGKVIENDVTAEVLERPRHHYTKRLLAAVPRVDAPAPDRPDAAGQAREPVLRCENVTREFRSTKVFGPRRTVRAIDEVTLTAYRGQTLGLVGESGAGKTTLARCLVKLEEVTSGRIHFGDEDITHWNGERLRALRRKIQMVFQDPYTSLNPRMTVRQIVAEPVRLYGLRPAAEVPGRVREILDMVELPQELADRYPVQLSGGQRQRVGIARALAAEPDVVIADEPVSALDVTIQRQIIELFARLQRELGLTLIVVAHDLGLVRAMCDQVAVMRSGRLVEHGDTESLFAGQTHPYTRHLITSARQLGARHAGSAV